MNLGHAHKTRFWYLLGVVSKFSNEHLRHFYRGVPPGIRARLRSYYLVNNLNIHVIQTSVPLELRCSWRPAPLGWWESHTGPTSAWSVYSSPIYKTETCCWAFYWNDVNLTRPSSWFALDQLIETFRFQDEDEDFSILSSVRAWARVILAGQRDSCRHSTTSFSENIVVAETSQLSGKGLKYNLLQ